MKISDPEPSYTSSNFRLKSCEESRCFFFFSTTDYGAHLSYSDRQYSSLNRTKWEIEEEKRVRGEELAMCSDGHG